jgi:hypothetical protein
VRSRCVRCIGKMWPSAARRAAAASSALAKEKWARCLPGKTVEGQSSTRMFVRGMPASSYEQHEYWSYEEHSEPGAPR